MPPKMVATPKYLRVPTAKVPSAVSTGSRPGRRLIIRSPKTEPSTPMKITSTIRKNTELKMPLMLSSSAPAADRIELLSIPLTAFCISA